MRMPRAARGGARCNCVSFGSFRWPPPALALCQIRSFLGPGAMRGSHQSLGGRICVAALICAALSAAADYAVDRDVVRQRPGPWRCSHHHLAASLDQALQTNYSTLGWSADLVAPLMADMRKCQELVLDQILQRSEYMSPLVTALTASCARPEHEFRLLVVNMDGSLLGDTGIATFAPVLSACTTIESLHALGSRLGDRGALALGAALQLHPKLRVVKSLQPQLRWFLITFSTPLVFTESRSIFDPRTFRVCEWSRNLDSGMRASSKGLFTSTVPGEITTSSLSRVKKLSLEF